jgi:hypothetical protein
MTNEEEFNSWKAKVELHLESMVKKSSDELNIRYDFLRDFKTNTAPNVTATRIIKRAYQVQT